MRFTLLPDEDVIWRGDDELVGFVHLFDGVIVQRVNEEGRSVLVLLQPLSAQRPRAVWRIGLLWWINTI